MKLNGYIERLNIFFEERRAMPYAWGTNDCVVYAADGVFAMTGVDPIADIRGTWTDEASAQALIQSMGGLSKAADERLKRRENAAMAERGDVCLVKDAHGRPSLALCMGVWCAAPGDDETLLLPRTKIRAAWEV